MRTYTRKTCMAILPPEVRGEGAEQAGGGTTTSRRGRRPSKPEKTENGRELGPRPTRPGAEQRRLAHSCVDGGGRALASGAEAEADGGDS